MDSVISEESAQEQLDVFVDYYGLDTNDIEVENGKDSVNTLFNGLRRMIQEGRLQIDLDTEECELRAVQTLKNPVGDLKTLTYRDKIARANISMDTEPSKKAQTRMYVFMTVITGTDIKTLMKLKGVDMTTFNRLTTLFSLV